jgi:hypothetical protein
LSEHTALVETHLANLLSGDFANERASERAYEYALQLLSEQEVRGAKVTAAHMAQAAELVRDALPGAWRLHNERSRVPPIVGDATTRKGKSSATDDLSTPAHR